MATVEERVWTMGDYDRGVPTCGAREPGACRRTHGTAHRVLRWWRPYAHSPCRLGVLVQRLPVRAAVYGVVPARRSDSRGDSAPFRALRTCRCGRRARGGGDAERPFDQRAGGTRRHSRTGPPCDLPDGQCGFRCARACGRGGRLGRGRRAGGLCDQGRDDARAVPHDVRRQVGSARRSLGRAFRRHRRRGRGAGGNIRVFSSATRRRCFPWR